jgi:hypothetical protein
VHSAKKRGKGRERTLNIQQRQEGKVQKKSGEEVRSGKLWEGYQWYLLQSRVRKERK